MASAVLDASALIAALADEPARPKVEAILRSRHAAMLRARHYHRRDRPLSLGDCVCLATAMSLSAALATTDPHLAALGRELGVEVLALPDSSGARP